MSDTSQNQEIFMRRFVECEPQILHYILATIPNLPDARDILQNTAVALWKKMEEYDPAVPFAPWALRFASVEIRAFLRQQRRHKRWLDEDVVELLLVHQEQSMGSKQGLADDQAMLKECLSNLPGKQRAVLSRYYFEEESVDRIAKSLGRSAEAIYKTLQRTRVALRDCIELRTKPAN